MLDMRILVPVRPRMMIVADLDKTMFNSHKKDPTWIGSKDFWIETFTRAGNIALQGGFDVYFAIVTNKPTFDDICETAAKELQPFFQSGNPAMFCQSPDGATHCLAFVKGEYYWECLSRYQSLKVWPNGLISNFIVQGQLDHSGHVKTKSPAILDLARHYCIPPENCILLDDTPKILQDARANKIKTISFECFNTDLDNPNRIKTEKLDDSDYIWGELPLKRIELFNEVREVLHQQEQAMINFCLSSSFVPNYQLTLRKESRFAAFFDKAPQNSNPALTPTSCIENRSAQILQDLQNVSSETDSTFELEEESNSVSDAHPITTDSNEPSPNSVAHHSKSKSRYWTN